MPAVKSFIFQNPLNAAYNEQRMFVVTNYLKTRSFKEVIQLFELGLRDRVSPTIWKNIKKYKTEGLSLILNKDRSGRMRTECTHENINLLQEKLSKFQEYQPESWFEH